MKENCINNMFDSDDYVILKNKKIISEAKVTFTGFGTKPSTAVALEEFNYVCSNAIDVDSDDKATNSNIITYRNFVIENDTLTIDSQLDKIQKSGIPVSNQIFSGNNSIHNIISLVDPLRDEDTFRAWFTAICEGLEKIGYKSDRACINPARLTRMPNAIHEKTGNIQEIKYSGSRVTQSEMLEWFESMSIDWKEYLPKYSEWTQTDGPNDADDERRWEVTKKFVNVSTEEYRNLGDGEREPYRFKIILKAKACGLSPDVTYNNMLREFPSSEGDSKLQEQIERCWKRDVEQINIISREQWVELRENQQTERYKEDFAKLLDVEYNLKNISDNKITDEDIPEDFDAQLHRYIVIGNDIYMIANRKLYKRTTNAFTIHHRKQDLRSVHRYVDFCTEPGYFNFRPVINKYYNNFQLPNWRPQKGNCDFTLNFMKHIGQGNYEEILDYLQINLISPRSTLPILTLISYEKGTAKSTFLEYLGMLFGNNVVPLDPKEFANLHWNTAWSNKHIITMDEVEKLGVLMEDFASKIKRQVYSKTIMVYKKGIDDEVKDFYGKFVLASNQEGGFVDITPDEDRYFILKVPQWSGEFDPNFKEKLENEIPYFVNYLLNRELKWKKPQGRSWFPISVLHNDAFNAIAQNSRPKIETDIDLKITEWFEDNPNETQMNFLIGDFMNVLGGGHSEKSIKETLHKLYGCTQRKKITLKNAYKKLTKEQRHFYTISKKLVITNDDVNESIAESFSVLM
jgi:hypothetical protein